VEREVVADEPDAVQVAPAPRVAVSGGPATLLALQRTAGNRAVARLVEDLTLSDEEREIANVVDEASDRSPTAARHILMSMKKGYTYRWAPAGEPGTWTSRQRRIVQVDKRLHRTRRDQVFAVMYESGNAVNEDLFDRVDDDNRSGRFKSADAYARAVLDAESTTVVYASIKALEAGWSSTSSDLDAAVRAATRPDPDHPGGLAWKSAAAADAVFKKGFNLAWDRATVTEGGQTVKARDFYGKRWVAPAP
jgi:hypothetical protein